MSRLTLVFRHDGEEVIVLRALADAYARVLAQVEVLRSASGGDDLAGLLTLASITDHAQDRCEQLLRRHRRACDRLALDDAELTASEAMAQGCAVLDFAGAGAPPTISHDAETPSTENPLFLGPQWQELPGGASLDDTQPMREHFA